MADLDAELLALAGGDSSDDEETKPTVNTTKDESPPSSAGTSVNNATIASTSKTVATPNKLTKTKSGTKKGTKMGKRDESEEEGEASSASPGSPNSLDSAPMSESEAENAPADGGDNNEPIFPVDNKFYSEKDKTEIMALPEVRREQILAERAAVLERKQQDEILRRLFQSRQAKEGEKAKSTDGKKRKVGAADVEDVQRKSSRQKTTLGGRKVGETSDAMEAYKRQREMKGAIAEQRKHEAAERKAHKGRGSSSMGSDADADGESVVEWDDGKPNRSESGPRDDMPAELHDYNRVHIGMDNFHHVCHYPGFDEAIKNCYVRINLGPRAGSNESTYRMAQIKAFTEGKLYAIDHPTKKLITTNQYAVVTIGKSERTFPFIFCSNSKFTVREYERYKNDMENDGLMLPTKAFLIKKIDDINKLINRSFTDAEIQEKLRRSGVLQRKMVSMERISLNARREEARAHGDEAAMAKIDARLLELQGPKLAFNTSPTKPAIAAPKEPTQQQRLAEVNRNNRKLNTQNVRKAQQAERRAAIKHAAAVERGEALPNPFARVKTVVKTHHDANKYLDLPGKKDDLFSGSEAGSRAGTPGTAVSGTTTPAKKELSSPKKEVSPVAPTPSPPASKGGNPFYWLPKVPQIEEAEFLATIDFGIDIEI
ncbi:hypothetical protein MMC13_003810 [Lambiella insularis]|nr:hypothetical protein [Lambiella insularis]